MAKWRCGFGFFILYLVLFASVASQPFASAQEQPVESSWDIVLKVNRLEETLTVVDELLAVKPGEPSPTVMLRGMLQGTAWIDPNRAIVMGVSVTEPKPTAVALIPFKTRNPTFEKTFNSVAGPDYQMISLPPGQTVSISTQGETALVAESRKTSDQNISLEISVRSLIKKGKSQVIGQVARIGPGQEGQKPALEKEQLARMSNNILETLRGLDTFGLGVSLSMRRIDLAMNAVAVPGTNLEKLFSPGQITTQLSAYEPGNQFNFRLSGIELALLTGILETSLGPTYREMGYDISSLLSIAPYFSGEMAGGMSHGPDGPTTESIAVLKEPQKPEQFMEKHFLPWLEEYSRIAKEIMEKKQGKSIAPVYKRTEDSAVSGHKVYGVQTMVPPSSVAIGAASGKTQTTVQTPMSPLSMRMTVVDRYLLTAPNDNRMGEMIQLIGALQPQPAQGARGILEINVVSYLQSLMRVVSNPTIPVEVPEKGTIAFTMQLEQGRMEAGSVVEIENIKQMVRYFKTLSASPMQADNAEERPVKKEETKIAVPMPKEEAQAPADVMKAPEQTRTDPAPKTSPPEKRDYDYYMHQGMLVSAYDNNAAAVKYYERAIKLNPRSGEAYFHLGVSYGDLGQYGKGLEALDKAIAMEPDNGTYYYGRGRLFIQAGHRETGMIDIRKAAELGNLDALNYLR